MSLNHRNVITYYVNVNDCFQEMTVFGYSNLSNMSMKPIDCGFFIGLQSKTSAVWWVGLLVRIPCYEIIK